jgi:hypothetical protein
LDDVSTAQSADIGTYPNSTSISDGGDLATARRVSEIRTVPPVADHRRGSALADGDDVVVILGDEVPQ